MALSTRLMMRQGQALVMTPQLLQAIKLLQFSHLELTAFVQDELDRNPLLERAEDRDLGPETAPAIDRFAEAEQAQAPGTAIFIDFPRVIRRDARAIALYLQAITERRCKRGDLIATAERALALDPSLAVAHTLIGEERHRRRDDDAAAAAYEKAIAADPEHAGAYIALGAMHEDRCRFADALPLLDRGWQLNPWDDKAAYLLCHSYARVNRRDDAIRACRSYVAHNRDADDADEIAALVNLMIVAGDAIPDMIAGLDRDRCP